MDNQPRAKLMPYTLALARTSDATRLGAFLFALVALALAFVPAFASSAQARPWVIQTTSKPGEKEAQLSTVTCLSRETCVAAGSNYGGSTILKWWNGTQWSNALSVPALEVDDISCTSPSSCIAVGYTVGGGESDEAAASWNGEKWSLMSTPNLEAKQAWLISVDCIVANECIAVGAYGASQPQLRTLAMRWDGKEWSKLAPKTTAEDSWFADVSCNLSTSCMAVGKTGNEALAESWDGEEWSAQPPISPGEGEKDITRLESVSCTGATIESTDCTAVGFGWNLEWTGNASTVAEAWNGEEWSLHSVPGLSEGVLYSVTCLAANECTAVGENWSGQHSPLAAVWNGSSWANDQPVDPGKGEGGSASAGFYDVACVSSQRCLAVGSHFNASNSVSTLAEATGGPVGIYLAGEKSGEKAKQPRLEAEIYPPTLIAGSQLSPLEDVLTMNGFAIRCEQIEFEAEAGAATNELSLGAEYGKCSVASLLITMSMNSCHYVMHVLNAGPPYQGSMDVACTKGGDAIEAKVYANKEKQEAGTTLCIFKIAPQNGLEGIGLGNTGAGSERRVAVELGLKGIVFTRTGSGLCGSSGSNGTYAGGMALAGSGF